MNTRNNLSLYQPSAIKELDHIQKQQKVLAKDGLNHREERSKTSSQNADLLLKLKSHNPVTNSQVVTTFLAQKEQVREEQVALNKSRAMSLLSRIPESVYVTTRGRNIIV